MEQKTELRNFTVEAQKILSCIYRMQKPYPLSMTLKVLMADQDHIIYELGFNGLSTYGLLKRYDRDYVLTMIKKLFELGYIKEAAGRISLTAKARDVLFEHQEVIAELPEEKRRIKPKLAPKDMADLKKRLRSYIDSILIPGRVMSGDHFDRLAESLPETHYEFSKLVYNDFFPQFEEEILAIIADYLE